LNKIINRKEIIIMDLKNTDKYPVNLTFAEIVDLTSKRIEAKISLGLMDIDDYIKNTALPVPPVTKKSNSIKPDYIFFYQNNDAVERLLKTSPFDLETPIEKRKGLNSTFIEYEHFMLRCIERNGISDNLRGYRTWQILIESCLYNRLTQEQRDCILMPIMSPYSILGGRIISVL